MRDCIEWEGARSGAGYGQTRVKGKLHYVHRLTYEKAYGQIPDGMVVRHKCDNPSCYNIEHLELGTQKENMQDASNRGRVNKTIKARGEAQGLSKLTAELVEQIRESSLGCTTLARELGVSKSTILRVRQGKTWRHI
ncbi:HNH endonuclease [Pectobacterium phage PPWS4]|uniref:Putative homing endonuclease n=1 Tax=Pectobacterium phage PPWS4 TaxID=1961914 RepID=A0A250KAA6_9CAUD|nr:HNH endonuclease [Pectobacterium phage PPWS4]BBA26449.1 putative homing endonuclease [Pectobacterium phage PPWS4]